ncbi:MAG: hypothetical protein EA411_03145 [Saprospirales bacterium]|nr:MAG: hypothetical protein EA411_03145 [Saprospirales bacterium]
MVLIPLSYNLMQDYYANELCTQRDMSENMCKGRCFINQQLQDAKDTAGDEKAPFTVKERVVNLFLEFLSFPTIEPPALNTTLNAVYKRIQTDEWVDEIFIPPRG